MSTMFELQRDLQLAMAGHRKTFGDSPKQVRQAREVVKILLWDNRSKILDALQIAVKRQVWNDLARPGRTSSSIPEEPPASLKISAIGARTHRRTED